MPVQGAALNTDTNGKLTASEYGDRGDGTSSWFGRVRAYLLEVGIGTTSESEATGNGSVIAILKRIRTLLGPGGTLANGTETSVSSTAVQVLASNTSRVGLIVQNTGSNAVRIGITGVTATTGFRLAAGAIQVFQGPGTPTGAIYAIRESADSTVLAQQITI